MGLASPVVRASLWELTRRTVGRQFLLRPDPEIQSAILYCFAYCAQKWDIPIHGISMMMNHYHAVLTDVRAQRVEFTMELHGLIARCVKALRAEHGAPLEGPVWEPAEQTGRVMIMTDEAFIEGCAYAIANPVEAGLVHNLSEWPGFVSSAWDMVYERELTVSRPECLSDLYPEVATLCFSMPSHLKERERVIAEEIDQRVKERMREARAQVVQEKRRFRTRGELLRVSPFASPKTQKRRAISKPTFRAASHRVAQATKKALRAWLHAYRCAFEAFRRGAREVEWPLGTWYYAKYAGVVVAEDGAWPWVIAA